MERRGFLGALAAVAVAPFVPAPKPDLFFRGVPVWADSNPASLDVIAPEVFHGSFKIGEITRRTRQTRIMANFDQVWRYQNDLLSARVEKTVRDLGEHIDNVYTGSKVKWDGSE